MLELDWRVHEVGDTTLVGAVVESSAPTPRRVTVETTLDGPVWPPRRDGIEARGWDGDRFEGVVPAGGRLALGFASPAEPTEPPLFVVDHERADGEPDDPIRTGDVFGPDGTGHPEIAIRERTPAGVLRALGSPRPPRDAVPLPEPPTEQRDERGRLPHATEPGPGESPGSGSSADARRPAGTDRPASTEETGEGSAAHRVADPAVPEAVGEWLTAVERRLRRAEALADARRVTAAARELERVGGIDGAERLVAALDRDERALRAVARRTRRLGDRRADADVPLATFRRLS